MNKSINQSITQGENKVSIYKLCLYTGRNLRLGFRPQNYMTRKAFADRFTLTKC